MQNAKCKIEIYRGEVTKGRICSFSRKRTKKLLQIGFAGILRKFSIKCEHFIGFEASILPLCASTTVSIASSKLRNSLRWSNFLKFTYCKAKPFYLMYGYVLRWQITDFRQGRKLSCVVTCHNTICAKSCREAD